MYKLLDGLRIVEGASFIAGPSCALHLAQMGAEVIRFDDIRGGPDSQRWPLSPNGASLYWEGLNKGKKSIALNLGDPAGRELAVELATAPGPDAGIFVTNYPADGFLSHERLAARRTDMITARVMGWADGRNGVDYTVNCAVGIPDITGPEDGTEPVNHVLPAWDLICGSYTAFTLMAALRRREREGHGQELRVPLGELALATLGHLGQVAEVSISGADRPRSGNDLFGAFGRDFVTADGHRIMLIGLTRRQWTSLVEALGLKEDISRLEEAAGADFTADEGARFIHRKQLFPLFERAIGARTRDELAASFSPAVMWAPYRSLSQALREDVSETAANPLFDMIGHPGGHSYPTPGSAAFLSADRRYPAAPAPRLGEHTDEVLASVLGLGSAEIGRLHDRGIVGGIVA